MQLRLGLEPTVFQLRSHTWSQDLMKLRFLKSHHRKNSVRDKVIGKKWIYLERNTVHRQSVGHLRRRERPLWLVLKGMFSSYTIKADSLLQVFRRCHLSGNRTCPVFLVCWEFLS